jgi:hypothetical protein
MTSAIEMVAHCLHHQSAFDPPFCQQCKRWSVYAADGWYCPECLGLVERRSCPICARDPW